MPPDTAKLYPRAFELRSISYRRHVLRGPVRAKVRLPFPSTSPTFDAAAYTRGLSHTQTRHRHIYLVCTDPVAIMMTDVEARRARAACVCLAVTSQRFGWIHNPRDLRYLSSTPLRAVRFCC